MPRIAQLFIVLAVLDIVARWLGLVEPRLFLSTRHPESFLSAFLPREALILLPAAVVLRRPDAAAATPWVLRGALIVALVELLSHPTRAVVSGIVGAQDEGVVVGLSVVTGVLGALGWLALGRGLSTLNPPAPPATVAGLANLAALLVTATIVLSLIGIAIAPTNLANPLDSAATRIALLPAWFGILTWAYLLRSVLRGLDDPSRSLSVTRLAAVGALLSASMTLFVSVLGLIYTLDNQIAAQVGNDPVIWAYFAGDTVGVTLIVVAIALGLADPLRPMAKDWDKAAAG